MTFDWDRLGVKDNKLDNMSEIICWPMKRWPKLTAVGWTEQIWSTKQYKDDEKCPDFKEINSIWVVR